MFFIALIVCVLTLAGYFLFFKSPSQSECSNNSNNVEETSSTPVGATALKTGPTVVEETPVLKGAASHEKAYSTVEDEAAPKFEEATEVESSSCWEVLTDASTEEEGRTSAEHIVISDKSSEEDVIKSLTSNVQHEVLNISRTENATEDATVLADAAVKEVEEAHLQDQQQLAVGISQAAEDLTAAPVEENKIHSEQADDKAQEHNSESESQNESLIQDLNPEHRSGPETNQNSCSVEIRVTEPESFFQTEILTENEIFQNEPQHEPTEAEPNSECQNHVLTESGSSENSNSDLPENLVKFTLGESSQDNLHQTEIENKIINKIECDGEEASSHFEEMPHDTNDVTSSDQQERHTAGGITRSAPVKCSSSNRSPQNSFASLSKIVEYECDEDLSVTPKNDDSHFQNEIDPKIVLMNERSDSIDEIVEANTLEIFSDHEKPKLKRQETMYDSAEVVTFVSRMNVCCAIFKNPADHRTHYYRKRFKVPKDEAPIPTELRNIAASFRVWGKHWDRIHHIKICQKSCASLEEPSKAVNRLEDQREDCQNKFGCRISLQDFDMLGTLDKKVLGDLLEKIHNNFVSEDDLAYFNLQDDSEVVDKFYFDL